MCDCSLGESRRGKSGLRPEVTAEGPLCLRKQKQRMVGRTPSLECGELVPEFGKREEMQNRMHKSVKGASNRRSGRLEERDFFLL